MIAFVEAKLRSGGKGGWKINSLLASTIIIDKPQTTDLQLLHYFRGLYFSLIFVIRNSHRRSALPRMQGFLQVIVA
jgi:hypothetical protein